MTGLCPKCEEPVPSALALYDRAERPWHEDCALRALAEGWRTPLSPAEATAVVEFECSEQVFVAPHAFHLREIVFEDDVEIAGIFVGAINIFASVPPARLRAQDLPGRRLVVDRDVPMGLHVTVHGMSSLDIRYRLIGERRPEKSEPRRSPPLVLGVGMLEAANVAPGEVTAPVFRMYLPFRCERLVVDDWESWEVVRVRLGRDRGSPVDIGGGLRLTGVSTALPAYEARVGEPIIYEMRNISGTARPLLGRVYGMTTFSS